jgi:hypothetical protein
MILWLRSDSRLGFAGALQEFGLPRSALVPALASFNLGMKIGSSLLSFSRRHVLAATGGLAALPLPNPPPLAGEGKVGAKRGNGTMELKRNGLQPSRKGPAEYFTGAVRIDPLFEASDPSRVSGASVTFEPGARTAWQTHPLGRRTLIVTSGLGWTQCWGGPVEESGRVMWSGVRPV